MVDLVEQLREGVAKKHSRETLETMLTWAADEIERLREENRELRRPLTGGEDASGWTGADKHNPYRRS